MSNAQHLHRHAWHAFSDFRALRRNRDKEELWHSLSHRRAQSTEAAAIFLDGIANAPTSSRVVRAAPIISYMVGWTRQRVMDYAKKRGWKIEPAAKLRGET